ncbi:MAG: peptide deformylase [Candidatus Gracilibacteria bacterium]|nr:peptide deformylase [Candidatus Gracilibacteria bacterium]
MLIIETGENNPILRKVAEKITDKNYNEAVKLGKEMLKYIKNPENAGVGLAAPQVGHSVRLVIVSLLKDRDDENFKTVIMINPEITEHSENKESDSEGCLSVPGEKGDVERYKTIKLTYSDEKKAKKTLILEGLSARIVQHEIDHLDGKLFTDYLNK